MTSPSHCWHVPDIKARLVKVTAAWTTLNEPAHEALGGCLVAAVTGPQRQGPRAAAGPDEGTRTTHRGA